MCFHSALASINSWGGGFASQSSNTLDISGRTAISPTLPRAQVVPSRFWWSKLAATPLDFESIEQALGCARIWVPAIAVSQQTLPHVHESTTASRDAWPGRTLLLSAIRCKYGIYKYFLKSWHSSIISAMKQLKRPGTFHTPCAWTCRVNIRIDINLYIYICFSSFFLNMSPLIIKEISLIHHTSCPNTYSC